MSIYDEDRKYVLWRLPAFSLAEPKRGDQVEIKYGRRIFEGTVSRVLSISEASESSGRLVEVEISRNADRLPLGSIATVLLNYFDIFSKKRRPLQ